MVKIILQNSDNIPFEFTASNKTLLENFEENNIDIPFSCRKGVCFACIVKVISGNFLLINSDSNSPQTLTCTTKIKSEFLDDSTEHSLILELIE